MKNINLFILNTSISWKKIISRKINLVVSEINVEIKYDAVINKIQILNDIICQTKKYTNIFHKSEK